MKRNIISLLLVTAMMIITLSSASIFACAEGAPLEPTVNWYEEGNFEIHNESDFLAFAKSLKDGNTFDGNVVYVMSDLDFGGYDVNLYDYIDRDKEFNSIIDGLGHTVSGLTYIGKSGSNQFSYSGLFGGKLVAGSTAYEEYDGACAGVFNLALINSSIEACDKYTGALFGSIERGTGKVAFDGVYVDVDVKSSSSHTGGFVGYNSNSNTVISNCVFEGSIDASCEGEASIGGFVGFNGVSTKDTAVLEITGSAFYGNITCSPKSENVGVFVGTNGKGENSSTLSISNCICAGTVTSPAKNGGITVGCNNKTVSVSADSLTISSTLANIISESGISAIDDSLLRGENSTRPQGFVATADGYSYPSQVLGFIGEYIGTQFKSYQLTEYKDGYCDMRLTAVLNDGKTGKSLAGVRAVGFDITMTVKQSGKVWSNKEGDEPSRIKTVYSSIMADGDTVSAESLDGDYIFIAVVGGIKQGVGELDFEITPFYEDTDGNLINGATTVFTFDTNALN